MKKGDRVRVIWPDRFKGKIGTVSGIDAYLDYVVVDVDEEKFPLVVDGENLEVIESNNEK